MLCISFNIKELLGGPKFKYLKWFFETNKSNIILIQETMSPGVEACDYFLNIFPSCEVCAFDAIGLSNGSLAIWNPLMVSLCRFNTCDGILLVDRVNTFDQEFNILNCYGPYKYRMYF